MEAVRPKPALQPGLGLHGRPHPDLDAVAFALADPAEQRRLIVVDESSTRIAHDVLLTASPRLRGRLESDLTGHALHTQLPEDAEDWARNGKAASCMYRGERLTGMFGLAGRAVCDSARRQLVLASRVPASQNGGWLALSAEE